MNNIILDEEILSPNPPEMPKFDITEFYYFFSVITMLMGFYLVYKQDKDWLLAFTISLMFSCTYTILKEIKNGK